MSLVLVSLLVASGAEFLAARTQAPIYPGPGVTSTLKLSHYFPDLEGSAGDTDVYMFDSGNPGGTVLVMGGTHPDEPAGYIGAVLLVEQAGVAKGRMIVIPQANHSGFTHTYPLEAHPSVFSIQTADGERWFRFGARGTNPVHQWPDPDIYTHWPSGQRLSGDETRNLNRSYPGRPDGVLTERVAYAIKSLIIAENVDITIDLHEAPLENAFINAVAAHERAMDVAVISTLNLAMQGINMVVEASPQGLRGLTHRELGDFTPTYALLMETPNPVQGRMRGRTDERLVLTGQDKCYEAAARLGRTYVPVTDSGYPLSLRVGRHVAGVQELINAFNEEKPDREIHVFNIPTYAALVEQGIGAFLRGRGSD